MKNNPIKIILIAVFITITTLSFSQTKQITPPNIISPFQVKKSNSIQPLITNNTKDTLKKSKLQIENVKGSFYVDLSKEHRTAESISKDFNKWFNLNNNHTFQLLSSKTDELNNKHDYYQQYYKGYIVEGSTLIIHSKSGLSYAANGQIAEFSNMETRLNISKEQALNIAKQFTKVTEVLNEYPVENIISRVPSEKGFDFIFAYKIRIDSSNPFVMSNIYVDVSDGKIINSISLIANENYNLDKIKSEKTNFVKPINDLILSDNPSTASTLYSGIQNIISDSYNGQFRLRDNSRKIETYDATNATGITTSGLTNSLDYINNSTSWGTYPYLTSFTVSAVLQSWWYTSIIDTSPDLYIIVKDASNNIVYNGRNFYKNNTFPQITFNNLSIPLFTQNYTIELWDYDPVGGDDFGGSYTIATISGTWSGNGNNGSYSILNSSNPAYDVHWGMEKTYDFYSAIFGRNSFDGNSSAIKNFLNPSNSIFINQSTPNGAGLPDNAFAAPPPYNYMVYGMGSNIIMKPVVGLDVEGHEYSHMVINNNGQGGLTYQGESGALNESFADILGTCVEFYGKPSSANWTIGEDVTIPAPYLRSMSNPKSSALNFSFIYNGNTISMDWRQPKKYNGTLWKSTTNLNDDHGGVHQNSGVQNFWFYLLSQGGSGLIDDTGNPYTVTGIGLTQARAIAYKNLTSHLTPNATYMDAYFGSLLAAQELYGYPSTQYSAVKQAWYAVGIGNDPNNFCSGTTNLTASSGTFSDGSGNTNYGNNANCSWYIAPAGANQITLSFSSFNTEATYDTVTVYDGPNASYPVLATLSGNSLPTSISTSLGTGAMFVKFTSDSTQNFSGWTANYSSFINTPQCSGVTILSTPSGSFNDGSISGNYTNNQQCYWYIAPPCATSVTLSFSQLDTELNYDGVIVYDSLTATTPLASYSGNSLPASITSNTGIMLVVFVSDFANNYSGFTANYTSTGSSYCTGITTLNTSDYGTITDGSGTNNYCDNSNCSWLIQPPQASSITLNFAAFELEQASSDGNSIYDAVEVYDGASASATLLGRFTGNNIPAAITSSGGSMFIRFYSDVSNNYAGWSAYYTSTQTPYCNGTATTLTASSGSFSDGSGANKYANNSNCSWLIQPANATSITLSFSSFDTELNYDGVIVYDGANSSAPVLGQFTGSSLPAAVTSTGGSMYISFLSDEALRANGWNASYTSTNSSTGSTTYHLDRKVLSSAGKTQTAGSTIITWTLGEPIIGNMNAGSVKLTNGFHPLLTSQALEIQEHSIDFSIIIAPNPASDYLNIYQKENHELNIKLFDITGKNLLEKYINTSENKLDVSFLPTGTYLVYVQDKLTNKTNTYKIIKN